MNYLESISIQLPFDEHFSSVFFSILSDCGKKIENAIYINQSNINFLPVLNINFNTDSNPKIIFNCDDLRVSKDINNLTGLEKSSPHKYEHISINEFATRLAKNGSIKFVDHLGVNFPWFNGISPVLIDLRQRLISKSAYYQFPTSEDWDFILPATNNEFESGKIDLNIERRPKLELVSFKKSSTPIIQIDCITTISFEKLKELFPESIIEEEMNNIWVYIKNDFGIDICFVLSGPSNSDWSKIFEGYRLNMSTKYILHGGNAQDKNTENNNFFKEILYDYPKKANILLVQFAAIPEKQEIYKARHISQFDDAKGDRELNFIVAEQDKFIEQLKWADIVYLCGSSGGGATTRLLETLQKFENIKEHFSNKTIAGESAGANCLVRYCYSRSSGIISGLGLVPVKLSTHYQLGDETAFADLPTEIDNLFLPSYKYKVFYY